MAVEAECAIDRKAAHHRERERVGVAYALIGVTLEECQRGKLILEIGSHELQSIRGEVPPRPLGCESVPGAATEEGEDFVQHMTGRHDSMPSRTTAQPAPPFDRPLVVLVTLEVPGDERSRVDEDQMSSSP